MDYKYIVHYLYGDEDGQVGCNSPNEYKKIAKGIILKAESSDEFAEITIQNVETGEVEPFFY